MPCTTILVGKKASFDGSTMMARNEDSGSGHFTPKKFIVVKPEEQPRLYRSVISKVAIPLPEEPLRYTAVPNALPDEGIWGEVGINAANVAMTETETITSNSRVQGADPLVSSGIGEEDLLTIVLPYIRSAREGVLRLGKLLEEYGTYEMNGIGFQDEDEIWWLESVGGHHWIAKRVPDDCYVVMPNQQGIDSLDLVDAFGEKKENLCSADLLDFIRDNALDPTLRQETPLEQDRDFDVRGAFGSRDDADHSYNTPRAWAMLRYLNPRSCRWEGPEADFRPEDDDLPWCMRPERKIGVDEVKAVLSNHFQGTPYDPYGKYGDLSQCGKYRTIGINRTNFLGLTQIRPNQPPETTGVVWLAMASNVFNAFVPFYAAVESTPDYLANTGKKVSADNFYWAGRLIGALADAHFSACSSHIERYQKKVLELGHRWLRESDAGLPEADRADYLLRCNQAISDTVQALTDEVLDQVLFEASMEMKNKFARSDA